MGAPSRIIAVPIAFIGASGPLELETWRMLICCAELISWFCEIPPGINDITSYKLVACIWSIAEREMWEDVDLPERLLVAVTVTSFNLKSSFLIVKLRTKSLFTFIKVSMETLPKYWICIRILPVGTFSSMYLPFSSEVVPSAISGIDTAANSKGKRLLLWSYS